MTSLTVIPKTTFPDSPWLRAVVERRVFELRHAIEDPEHGSVLLLRGQAIQDYLDLLAAEEQLAPQSPQQMTDKLVQKIYDYVRELSIHVIDSQFRIIRPSGPDDTRCEALRLALRLPSGFYPLAPLLRAHLETLTDRQAFCDLIEDAIAVRRPFTENLGTTLAPYVVHFMAPLSTDLLYLPRAGMSPARSS